MNDSISNCCPRAMTRAVLVAGSLLLVGCGERHVAQPPDSNSTQELFWNEITELCGRAFAGRVRANEGAGAGPDPFEGQALVMHVRTCSSDEIRIPLHVGDDRSRTWVITRADDALRLKHDHRHADGSEDAVTQYGGDTVDEGGATEQRFPADDYSKELFIAQGLTQSVDNTWVVGIEPARRFSYALIRPGRHFQIDFDLTQPVDSPPPPWGSE
jgi:hypothetical protein